MKSLLRRLYDSITWPILEKWIGPLQAAAVVRSLYLQSALSNQIPHEEGRRVLDAGSGEEAAATLVCARRHLQYSFTALDLYLQIPQGGHLPLPENIDFVQTDLFDFVPAVKFDVIVCMDVLEHIENASGVLDLFSHWIEEGGYLVVHVPSKNQVRYLTKVNQSVPSKRSERPGDKHVRDGYDIDELEHEVKRAGFSTEYRRFTFSPTTWFIKEVYSILEARGIRGIGLLILPFLYTSIRLEMSSRLSRGNGLFFIARKVDRG